MHDLLILFDSAGGTQITHCKMEAAGRIKSDPVLRLAPGLDFGHVWCKLALKERATTNEIKYEPEQKQGGEAAVELLY